MNDLNQALAEIHTIRGQVARVTEFRGYGPASHVITGLLAFAVAAVQTHWLNGAGVTSYLAVWVSTAAFAVLCTGIETVMRTRRMHRGFVNQMMFSALESFLPALVAGILLTAVLLRFAPAQTWMLPGLWQILFSLGVFASCQFLPRPMFCVGAWYLACGLGCLVMQRGDGGLSPWAMGIPFGVGQLAVAAVLRFGLARVDERSP